MPDRNWREFDIRRRIREEWKDGCKMTGSKKFDWEKYGAKKAIVHRGGTNKGASYILHTAATPKTREQYILSFCDTDAENIEAALGGKVDIGTMFRLNEFVILIASGESLSLVKANNDSLRMTVSCNSIKNEIKGNVPDDFYHYGLEVERIVGEQAFILHPTKKID